MKYSTRVEKPDVILIGSGIMSANLAVMLKRLEPGLSIQVLEVTDGLAEESSNGWNNAGTGHAGICELSYTPKREADGSVNVTKAIEIFEQFEYSRQFWSHALESGMIEGAGEFITRVPHLSFVHGQENVDFLRTRHAAMSSHHFFDGMEFSSNRDTIRKWAPLLVDGRDQKPIAATRMEAGTDVNFGNVSRKLLDWLAQQENCGILTSHKVENLRRTARGWEVQVRDNATSRTFSQEAKFVFVGAGGGSLRLLQKAGIPEARGLGGFPIGGQWLVCENPDVVRMHEAKVYGQPLGAAPTMAVPHLDTRVLNGRKMLLFGPFAAFTTKFLHKKGSHLDLFSSIKPDNVFTLANIGIHNLDLVKYLVQQGTQSMGDRMKVLREFYPLARTGDWKLIDAGIRVQAIKKTDGRAGIVHYGTEVITDGNKTISALLGASPGASVSVAIMIEVIGKCLPSLLASEEGRRRMKAMIPTYGTDFKRPENAVQFLAHSHRADSVFGFRSTPALTA